MIEVLRIGNMIGKAQKDYRVTCWRCNALFRFDKFDTLYDPWETGEYIRCPQCKALLEKWRWEEEE